MPRKNFKCGVYCISHVENSRCYVGSSAKIEKRIEEHKYKLRRGIVNHPKLTEAWEAFGEEAFVFRILEECTEDLLKIREQYWIEKLNSVSEGYNIQAYAANAKGRPVTEETRAKLRAANAEYWTNGNNEANRRARSIRSVKLREARAEKLKDVVYQQEKRLNKERLERERLDRLSRVHPTIIIVKYGQKIIRIPRPVTNVSPGEYLDSKG